MAKAPLVYSEEKELGNGDLKDGVDLNDDLEDNLEQGSKGEVVEELTVEVDSKDRIDKVGVSKEEYNRVSKYTESMEAAFPSICLKIKMVCKLVPLESDCAWIKEFKELDKLELAKLKEYLLSLMISCHWILLKEMNISLNSMSTSLNGMSMSLQKVSLIGHLTLIPPVTTLSLKIRIVHSMAAITRSRLNIDPS